MVRGPYASLVERRLVSRIDLIERARWSMLRLLLETEDTLAEAATKVGIPRRRLSEILRGIREPTLRDLAVWSAGHGYDLTLALYSEDQYEQARSWRRGGRK